MTKVTIDEITYSVTVAEENVNVTVADATETIQIQIASGASDTQVLSSGGGNSLVVGSTGGVATLKSLSAGDNVTFSDDGNTITISSTEDDLSNNTTDDLAEGTTNLYYTQARADYATQNYSGNIDNMGNITGDDAVFTNISGALSTTGITAQATNLTIDPNGFLFVDTDNMYVGSLSQATHITGTTIGSVGTPVTITSGDILPATHLTYDLGSPTKAWHSAYVGPGSLYIDGQKVLGSDASGDIDITTDSGQNLNISSGADVKILPQVGETGQGFVVELDRVELGYDGGSTTTITGTLEAPDLHVGDLEIDPTLINNTGTNQNLEIRTNGTGYVHINTADFYVGPLTGAVKIDENSISTTDVTQLTIEGFTNSADMTTAINTAETNANTYTDTREIAITSAYQTYADQAEADAITTANSYADTAISNLVDSAPATLDTLNELAAALGDDANFSTTVTNSIATKWTQDNTKISNWDTAYSWGDHSVEGYLTSFTETDPIFIGHVASSITSTEITNWNNAYGWGDHSTEGYLTSYTETDPVFTASPANGITSTNISNWNTAYGWGDHSLVGYITDYTVTQSDVTVHQAALSITESQISDLSHFSGSYTDLTNKPTIPTNNNQLTNGAGFITTYDPTEADITEHQAALSITESQISDLTHYTNAQAISAVQGETTLDLTGDVTIAQDLDVTGLIKVNDGFTLSSFDPYGPAGLPSTAMPTTIMGIGQEEGWAGLTIRSRGEHAWGLTGYGIPNEKPRALLNLTGGRLDGSSDDYLNDADNFGSILFNPYSGYKTGTEWLTPSAYVEAIATEDHSSSGMGTKLVINTTENGNQAGATDSSHTNKSITIQGTTISTSDKLKIDDDVEITGQLSSNGSELSVADNLKIVGSGSSNTVIGDALIANTYATHGFKVNADETNWAGITLEEYVGGSDKPINAFPNATLAAQVFGGTPSAKSNVVSGKRLLTLQGLAANQSDGTLPQTANFRVKGETTEDQTTSNRGTKLTFESIANGSNSTTETLKIQGNEIVINTSGDGVLKSGGDLTIDDDVIVTGSTNLNGNVTLGDANTDVITSTGKLKASNGFNNTVLDTNTANYLSGVLQIVETGDQAYISDGNAGSPCMAFYDGSNWKKFHSPSDNISSS